VSAGGVRQRLLTFEVGGAAWGLPIADVLEVAEVGPLACVPTLPRRIGGVTNHHGDALPVIEREALFGGESSAPPAQLLVIGDRPDAAGRLGLPVDRVLGLADLEGGLPRGAALVLERRPIDGRVVGVLNTRVLLARAAELFESAGEREDGLQGGSR